MNCLLGSSLISVLGCFVYFLVICNHSSYIKAVLVYKALFAII